MSGPRPITVLGVSVSNVATACLLRDGQVVACVSEERLNRVKSWSGFPTRAVHEVLRMAGLTAADVDRMVLHGYSPWVYGLVGENGAEGKRRWHLPLRHALSGLMYRQPALWPVYRELRDRVYRPIVHGRWQRERLRFASEQTGIAPERIVATDHHVCHAYAGVHSVLGRPDGKYLVLTNDGRGDDCCAAVWVYDAGRWERLAATPNDHSIGYLYLAATELLGMKPNEHEYKVMGMAPYAAPADVARSLAVMNKLSWCSDLRFDSVVPSQSFYDYFHEHLERHRFDWISGAVQEATERLLRQWVANAIRATGIHDVVLSGGTFLNVKANMIIGAMPEVETLTICPSPSDDSTAIGAAYWGYEQECAQRGVAFEPRALNDLYLGPAYTREEMARSIERFRREAVPCVVERPDNMEQRIAELLAAGEVVACFDGRMEFGARALGNRSLLANPSDPGVIEVLNRQIKSRDFWMPFAGTVLREREHDYLRNPKRIAAPHMVITFETTPLAQRDMPAAMHPVDHTMRPQVLDEQVNPRYYRIIKHFERLTGIGGLLNTSLNLHGEPIACTPDDALHTFAHSGLRHLALGDWVITKLDVDISAGKRHDEYHTAAIAPAAPQAELASEPA
ncbi:MAG: carbamoyltransferase C-terminal domain-containing protein [Ktedonobacterales bacterium]